MTVEEAKKIAKLECALEFCKKESMLEQYVSDEKWKYFDVAANAIEKQMPKKIHISPYIYTRCNCGYEFSIHYGDGYYGVPEEKKTHFCPNCGQALDWSDTE